MGHVRVAVLRGGLSDEYKVSLQTGASVLNNLDTALFEPIDVVISRAGEWLVDGRARLPEHILHCVDVVFIALHGAYGEDGTVQRLLDRYCVPYTGSKAFASRIAMNKLLTKQYLKQTDIRMAPHMHVHSDSLDELPRITEKITQTFGPQYIIKPVASGSSVGAMMVKNPLLLTQALRDALSLYEEVMVEQFIPGKEATCGVIERYRDTRLYVLPPIEIVKPDHAEFFDTQVKYDGTTQEFCPARFDTSTKREIERIAQLVHETLGLSQYSRSDFIVAPDAIYFLEVNTLPGLTSESLFPRALSAVGASHTELITHLLTDALART